LNEYSSPRIRVDVRQKGGRNRFILVNGTDESLSHVLAGLGVDRDKFGQ
jgi:hypothetical protein